MPERPARARGRLLRRNPREYLSRHWSQSAITTCLCKPRTHTHSAAKIRRRSLTFTFLRQVGHLLPLRTSPNQCMGRFEAWRKCGEEEARKQHERPGPILEPIADAYVAEQMTCPGAGEKSVPMRNTQRTWLTISQPVDAGTQRTAFCHGRLLHATQADSALHFGGQVAVLVISGERRICSCRRFGRRPTDALTSRVVTCT